MTKKSTENPTFTMNYGEHDGDVLFFHSNDNQWDGNHTQAGNIVPAEQEESYTPSEAVLEIDTRDRPKAPLSPETISSTQSIHEIVDLVRYSEGIESDNGHTYTGEELAELIMLVDGGDAYLETIPWEYDLREHVYNLFKTKKRNFSSGTEGEQVLPDENPDPTETGFDETPDDPTPAVSQENLVQHQELIPPQVAVAKPAPSRGQLIPLTSDGRLDEAKYRSQQRESDRSSRNNQAIPQKPRRGVLSFLKRMFLGK